jgi:hypothetical protein
MLSGDSEAILIMGANDGSRPWLNSTAFAPAKFAVFALVRWRVITIKHGQIDATVVDVDVEDPIDPAAIADAFWYLVHQDRGMNT